MSNFTYHEHKQYLILLIIEINNNVSHNYYFAITSFE